MGITSAMFTGVSGLLANAENMTVIGNNLSNVNTVGFKSGRMLFSDVLSVNIGNDSQIGRGTQIQKVDNMFGQGSFETTESVTDLALQGSAFFALGLPDASAGTALTGDEAYYTRAGAFRFTPDTTASPATDNYLTNPDGYRLLDVDGNPIMITIAASPPADTEFVKITKIDTDGKIQLLLGDGTTAYYDGNPTTGTTDPTAAKRVGTILIPNPNALEKVGGTLFKASANAGITSSNTEFSATYDATNDEVTSEKMFSNSLEQSNVDMAAQFVKMILTQRAYSANSKTITTSDEMTQEVINLKR
jgi:flagellar hook protein FlgE